MKKNELLCHQQLCCSKYNLESFDMAAASGKLVVVGQANLVQTTRGRFIIWTIWCECNNTHR